MNAQMLDRWWIGIATLLAASLAVGTPAFGQRLPVSKVVLVNDDSTATATIIHRVAAAGRFRIPVDPEHADEIAASLRATPSIQARLPATAPGESAQIQGAFRLNFDALKDDELSRRLDKLVGKPVRVVRTSGEPREVDGTLSSFTATTVTIDTLAAPIDRTKIDSIELGAQSLRNRPARYIAVTATGPGDLSYTFSAKPWTVSYQVDATAQAFLATAAVVNGSAVPWPDAATVDLQSGRAFFRINQVSLAPQQAGAFNIQPFNPAGSQPRAWGAQLDRFRDRVFDASEQPSNDSPYVMLQLSIPSNVGPWLIDGQVTASVNGRLITAKLPKADSKLRRQAPPPGAAAREFRYIKLWPEPNATVKYDGPREVFGKIISLGNDRERPDGTCEETDERDEHKLTVRLGRLTTYTARFEGGANFSVQVLARTEPGWTLSPASGVFSLSSTAATAEALAVSDHIELTFDTRIADAAPLRDMARRYSGQCLARKLLDILPDDHSKPVAKAWPLSPPGAAD